MGNSYASGKVDLVLPIIDSLLPNLAFLGEATASAEAIAQANQFSTAEFLNLTTYLISNNLPGEANGERLYKWFRDYGSTNILKVLSSMKGPTTEAMDEPADTSGFPPL